MEEILLETGEEGEEGFIKGYFTYFYPFIYSFLPDEVASLPKEVVTIFSTSFTGPELPPTNIPAIPLLANNPPNNALFSLKALKNSSSF